MTTYILQTKQETPRGKRFKYATEVKGSLADARALALEMSIQRYGESIPVYSTRYNGHSYYERDQLGTASYVARDGTGRWFNDTGMYLLNEDGTLGRRMITDRKWVS